MTTPARQTGSSYTGCDQTGFVLYVMRSNWFVLYVMGQSRFVLYVMIYSAAIPPSGAALDGGNIG